ncbi:hypothetical protein SBOR_4129 [Sclerotinia borealis F-4128]|uniref:Uncharacterized protein n=1 Tax=Sclerotinia borealis (strain F-4128) TaxID=1432307 RepID=W9CLT4_SCLBF|nr:hypothetical protein SBOR_4129 [Sclerotinia borealis F-4128]
MPQRPTRTRRPPARYRDDSDQAASSSSKPPASVAPPIMVSSPTPPPPTPSYSTSSSPSITPSTPTPSTRRGGTIWRDEVRRTLLQVDEEGTSPVQPVSPPSQPGPNALPVYTSDDEYDITSSGFGLKHTPEWDGAGIDMNDYKPRWFPSALVGSPSYENLTDACKLMMVHELTKRMTFKTMVSWMQLTDTQLIDFVRIYEFQSQRNVEEERLTNIAMERLDKIRKMRDVTTKDWDIALEEEVDSKLSPSLIDSPIPLVEIGRTIRYLQSFHIQEELEGLRVDTPEGPQVFATDDIPPFLVIEEVNEAMKRYAKLSVELEWELDHDIGLRDYIEHETDLAGGVEGIVLSDDEAEKPAQRPIGRPKKTNRRFANKPLKIKSDLIKLRLPSKLQQMESVEDNNEAEGDDVSKGKGKGKGRRV